MPSCAEFGLIDQYLSLKEAVDSGEETFLNLAQEVPQFLSSQDFNMSETVDNSGRLTSELPNNFLGELEPAGSLYLQEVSNPLARNTITPVPYNHSTTTSSSDFLPATAKTVYVAPSVGSGCTVIQSADQQLSGLESPELFDLDSQTQTLYPEDSCRGLGEKPIKTEPQMESEIGDNGMRDFLIESLREDILQACANLSISPDPMAWDHQDTQRWVQYICRKNNSSDECAIFFQMKGETLCQLGEEEFNWRTQSQGKFLQENVEIWKMMAWQTTSESRRHQNFNNFSDHSNVNGGGHSSYMTSMAHTPHMPPSISPAPSTDSTCSTLSSSSGGHGPSSFNFSQESLDDEVFNTSRHSGHSTPHTPHTPPTHVPPPPHRAARTGKQTIHLWQFLLELLEDPETYHTCIKWLDRSRRIFKIEDSSRVARLWGRRKNRPAMNYDKLSRSVRQYYKKGIIKKTEHSKRLVYQFCKPDLKL